MTRERVLVCPDKFRDSLSAWEAAQAMAAGLRDAGSWELDVLPLADGGEGTLEILLGAIGGERVTVETVDALGFPVLAEWGSLADGTAVVESATAAGLSQVGAYRDPCAASTAGLGRVIDEVLAQRPRRLVVTVGGLASTDGGLGLLDAIGWSLRGVETTVACDVGTTFVNAAPTFAPQKGASADQVIELTARLEKLAHRYAVEARAVAGWPGSGAGGGLAGGLAAIGATLRPGFDVVASAVRFGSRLDCVQAVVTGEGRLDGSSLDGKVVGRVLRAAGQKRLSSAVIVGSGEASVVSTLTAESVYVRTVRALAVDDEDSRRRAATIVSGLTAQWAIERLLEPPGLSRTDSRDT